VEKAYCWLGGLRLHFVPESSRFYQSGDWATGGASARGRAEAVLPVYPLGFTSFSCDG
jgi:hypothetical protein